LDAFDALLHRLGDTAATSDASAVLARLQAVRTLLLKLVDSNDTAAVNSAAACCDRLLKLLPARLTNRRLIRGGTVAGIGAGSDGADARVSDDSDTSLSGLCVAVALHPLVHQQAASLSIVADAFTAALSSLSPFLAVVRPLRQMESVFKLAVDVESPRRARLAEAWVLASQCIIKHINTTGEACVGEGEASDHTAVHLALRLPLVLAAQAGLDDATAARVCKAWRAFYAAYHRTCGLSDMTRLFFPEGVFAGLVLPAAGDTARRGNSLRVVATCGTVAVSACSATLRGLKHPAVLWSGFVALVKFTVQLLQRYCTLVAGAAPDGHVEGASRERFISAVADLVGRVQSAELAVFVLHEMISTMSQALQLTAQRPLAEGATRPFQSAVAGLFSSLASMLRGPFWASEYNTGLLAQIHPLFQHSLTHPTESLAQRAIDTWSATFGQFVWLEYPETLVPVLRRASRLATGRILPTPGLDQDDAEMPATTLDVVSVGPEATPPESQNSVLVKDALGSLSPAKSRRSFLRRSVVAVSASTSPVKRQAAASRVLDLEEGDGEQGRRFSVIQGSPVKRPRVELTEHQQERREEQREEIGEVVACTPLSTTGVSRTTASPPPDNAVAHAGAPSPAESELESPTAPSSRANFRSPVLEVPTTPPRAIRTAAAVVGAAAMGATLSLSRETPPVPVTPGTEDPTEEDEPASILKRVSSASEKDTTKKRRVSFGPNAEVRNYARATTTKMRSTSKPASPARTGFDTPHNGDKPSPPRGTLSPAGRQRLAARLAGGSGGTVGTGFTGAATAAPDGEPRSSSVKRGLTFLDATAAASSPSLGAKFAPAIGSIPQRPWPTRKTDLVFPSLRTCADPVKPLLVSLRRSSRGNVSTLAAKGVSIG